MIVHSLHVSSRGFKKYAREIKLKLNDTPRRSNVNFFNQTVPGRIVESRVPWKMKTLSPRIFETGSIRLLAARPFVCVIKKFTLTEPGLDIQRFAAARPPIPQ